MHGDGVEGIDIAHRVKCPVKLSFVICPSSPPRSDERYRLPLIGSMVIQVVDDSPIPTPISVMGQTILLSFPFLFRDAHR